MGKKSKKKIYVGKIDMHKALHDSYEGGPPPFRTGAHMTEKDRPRDKSYKKNWEED